MRCQVSLQVSFEPNVGHRPALQIMSDGGPDALCSRIPFGNGTFQHIAELIAPQCGEKLNTAVSAGYETVNVWFPVGAVELDREKVAIAAQKYPLLK